jgi:hypothetical protein
LATYLETLDAHHEDVSERLARMSAHDQARFALSCAAQLMPFYGRYATQRKLAADLLEKAVRSLPGEPSESDLTAARAALADVDAATPSAGDGSTLLRSLATNASLAVAGSLQARLEGDEAAAASASDRVIEAYEYVLRPDDDAETVPPEIEEELRRQRNTLEKLEARPDQPLNYPAANGHNRLSELVG